MNKRMEGKEKSPRLEKTVVWRHCLPVHAYRKLGPWRTQHSLRASETEKSSSPTLTDATKTFSIISELGAKLVRSASCRICSLSCGIPAMVSTTFMS